MEKPVIVAIVGTTNGKTYHATELEFTLHGWLHLTGYDSEYAWPNFDLKRWVFSPRIITMIQVMELEGWKP